MFPIGFSARVSGLIKPYILSAEQFSRTRYNQRRRIFFSLTKSVVACRMYWHSNRYLMITDTRVMMNHNDQIDMLSVRNHRQVDREVIKKRFRRPGQEGIVECDSSLLPVLLYLLIPLLQSRLLNQSSLIAALPDASPIITGGKSSYHVGNVIDVNCTSQRTKPALILTWFINGLRVCILSYLITGTTSWSSTKWTLVISWRQTVISIEHSAKRITLCRNCSSTWQSEKLCIFFLFSKGFPQPDFSFWNAA